MKTEAGQEAVADIPTDTGNFPRSDDTSNGQKVSPGIASSIRPGVPCPETVLVAVMSDGSYLLLGHPQGEPAAFVVRDDADLLRRGLAGAFGSAEGEVVSGNGIAVPGREALRGEKAQA